MYHVWKDDKYINVLVWILEVSQFGHFVAQQKILFKWNEKTQGVMIWTGNKWVVIQLSC
jgi:hypothetical protein